MSGLNFVDYVYEELPRRPIVINETPAGNETTGNPNHITEQFDETLFTMLSNADRGTFYIDHETNTAYQKTESAEGQIGQWDEIGVDADRLIHEVLDAMTKDIIFQLGEQLDYGPMTNTELYIPYDGNLSEVIVGLDSSSAPSSNFYFSIQKFDSSAGEGGEWVPLVYENYQLDSDDDVDEYTRKFDIEDEPYIDNERLRVYLHAGDLININSINMVARIKRAEIEPPPEEEHKLYPVVVEWNGEPLEEAEVTVHIGQTEETMYTDEDGTTDYPFEIPDAGYFTVEVGHEYIDYQDIERDVWVDGETTRVFELGLEEASDNDDE